MINEGTREIFNARKHLEEQAARYEKDKAVQLSYKEDNADMEKDPMLAMKIFETDFLVGKDAISISVLEYLDAEKFNDAEFYNLLDSMIHEQYTVMPLLIGPDVDKRRLSAMFGSLAMLYETRNDVLLSLLASKSRVTMNGATAADLEKMLTDLDKSR